MKKALTFIAAGLSLFVVVFFAQHTLWLDSVEVLTHRLRPTFTALNLLRGGAEAVSTENLVALVRNKDRIIATYNKELWLYTCGAMLYISSADTVYGTDKLYVECNLGSRFRGYNYLDYEGEPVLTYRHKAATS